MKRFANAARILKKSNLCYTYLTCEFFSFSNNLNYEYVCTIVYTATQNTKKHKKTQKSDKNAKATSSPPRHLCFAFKLPQDVSDDLIPTITPHVYYYQFSISNLSLSQSTNHTVSTSAIKLKLVNYRLPVRTGFD